MSKKRSQAPKPYWNRMFHRYSQLIRHTQNEKPSWHQMLHLASLRKALVDFRSGRSLPKQVYQPVWTSKKRPISRNRPRRPYLPDLNFENHSLRNVTEITELEDRKSHSSNYIWSSDRLRNHLGNWKKTRAKSWKFPKVIRLSKEDTFLVIKRKSFKQTKNPYKISSSALHYKASPRIHYLAKPKKTQLRVESPRVPRKKSSRKISTKRLKNLAKPKLREDMCTRKTPFRVPDRALRAKATSRLQELANPKTYPQREVTGIWRLSEQQYRYFQIPVINCCMDFQ
ncbi:uncharacterized protein LOC119560434 [Drosophila subpulchrella]|uniref:uncharacterized protein LOC119560434 n=1 Tax=Drosophila subpulchrella TaxID=1486046 RepID=UPI0018A12A62|nr:uncharacterized protein LOC119560434 [Drosophila subpulchrella]